MIFKLSFDGSTFNVAYTENRDEHMEIIIETMAIIRESLVAFSSSVRYMYWNIFSDSIVILMMKRLLKKV